MNIPSNSIQFTSTYLVVNMIRALVVHFKQLQMLPNVSFSYSEFINQRVDLLCALKTLTGCYINTELVGNAQGCAGFGTLPAP